ncbi:MAG: Rps23 Pro-64 3,4-dihydroxylase Tpa1-like proline 4-hydroxylase [Cyclobacteriaceae bacterium]|jgi:Rps23 Pro-64 3,4-dihydroxylase Tpa1-like proline 4-hydroxylase
MQRLFLFAIVFLLFLHAQSQQIITGQVLDGENDDPLPFATLVFKNSTVGTVSNSEGSFNLQMTSDQVLDTIIISYIGYEDLFLSIPMQTNNLKIRLTQAVMQLEELVILPLSPQDYLKRAVRKFGNNYAVDAFTTKAYYRELFAENSEYVALNEAVFHSFYPDYQDTINNQHQLLLYRNTSDKQEIAFMKNYADKQIRKEKKKAEKKGEEWNEEDARSIIKANFGGPETILSLDLIKEGEDCLDTTLFKKFKYNFGLGLTYQGRDLMEITFESKGQVEHQRQKGIIYLDIVTDAIVGLEYQSELVVPIALQPILFAFGLGIKDAILNKKIRYQFQEGRWYPDTFQWEFSTLLKKRHMLKSNEASTFDIKQIFKVNELVINDKTEIPKEQQFDPSEEMEKQVQNTKGLEWAKVNTLPIEALQ